MPAIFETSTVDGPNFTWLDIRDTGESWISPTFRVKPWNEIRNIHTTRKVFEDHVVVKELNFAKHLRLLMQQDIKIMEVLEKYISVPFDQGIKISESHIAEIQLMFDERVKIKELIQKRFRLMLDEAFKASESSQVNKITKALQQKFIIAEDVDHQHTYIRDFLATAVVREVEDIRKIGKNVESIFSVIDELIFRGIYHQDENLKIEEEAERIVKYFRQPIEKFDAMEAVPEFDVIKRIDTVKTIITESSAKDLTHIIPDEKWIVWEYFESQSVFNLDFESKAKVREEIRKLIKKPFDDKVSIVDEMLKNGDLSISDMIVLSKAISDSDFEEIMSQSSPKGYGPFKPFLAGDYDYKEALLRVLMTTKNQSRPYIEQLNVEVDLPDIFDAGTYSFTKAGTSRIKFNRHFYIVPEVSVAIRAGTTKFVPSIRIVNIEKEYFDVVLENPDSKVPVLGTITWKAQGY